MKDSCSKCAVIKVIIKHTDTHKLCCTSIPIKLTVEHDLHKTCTTYKRCLHYPANK